MLELTKQFLKNGYCRGTLTHWDMSGSSTYLMMLLMQDLRNIVLQTSKLMVDVMQELIQVCSLKLTALDQNLLGENKKCQGTEETEQQHT